MSRSCGWTHHQPRTDDYRSGGARLVVIAGGPGVACGRCRRQARGRRASFVAADWCCLVFERLVFERAYSTALATPESCAMPSKPAVEDRGGLIGWRDYRADALGPFPSGPRCPEVGVMPARYRARGPCEGSSRTRRAMTGWLIRIPLAPSERVAERHFPDASTACQPRVRGRAIADALRDRPGGGSSFRTLLSSAPSQRLREGVRRCESGRMHGTGGWSGMGSAGVTSPIGRGSGPGHLVGGTTAPRARPPRGPPERVDAKSGS
jgi:hypothetical protein